MRERVEAPQRKEQDGPVSKVPCKGDLSSLLEKEREGVRERMKVEKCPICEAKGSLHVKWVLNKIKKRYEPYYGVAHYNRETKRLRWCYVNRRIAMQLIHDSFPNTRDFT